MKASGVWLVTSVFAVLFMVSGHAGAFPGFIASKKTTDVKLYSTEIVLMKKGPTTAITVMPDYEGPLEPFTLVVLVPADVTAERVTTLARGFVDHIEQITAPRFQEFWEQDPCDPGPPQQEWERSMKADPNSAFLGGGMPEGTQKVSKELSLDVKAKTKQGEYTFTLLGKDDAIGPWLKSKGYLVPAGAEAAVAPYVASGMRLLAAQVDTNRIELVGGERAQLSPIRFWTAEPYDSVPDRVGLVNAPDKQELLIYVLDPESRYEVKNYKNVFPPTNVHIDLMAKERMGEFYGALHDILLAQYPGAFLDEFAWNSDGCGQPCATEPLLVHELLSLGGDVFESSLPEAERKPKPPELTKEEKDTFKESLKGLKKKERREREKAFKEDRETVAERKALVARQKYTLSRLHYRYDAKTLPEDPKVGPASGPIEGGVAIPKGKTGEAVTEAKPASANRFQARYNEFHTWLPVIQCPAPERYRWAKIWPEVQLLRKTWIAEDLSRKSRTLIKPAQMIKTDLPALGLRAAAAPVRVPDAGADGGASKEKEKPAGKCGCRVPGERAKDSRALAAIVVLLGSFVALRRRRAKPRG